MAEKQFCNGSAPACRPLRPILYIEGEFHSHGEAPLVFLPGGYLLGILGHPFWAALYPYEPDASPVALRHRSNNLFLFEMILVERI